MTDDLLAGIPTHRIGSISPLDLIDSSTYEFYKIAPATAIQSSISIGLGGFSGEAAREAFSTNIARCVSTLARRQVQVIILNGLPLILHLPDSDLADYHARCDAEGVRSIDGMEAAVAALKALGVTRPAVGNKWDDDLNEKLRARLAGEGITISATVTDPHTADQVKGTFESGAALAYHLAKATKEASPDADCVYLAGGAWLTLQLIDRLEQELGVPVVTGQQSAHWYSLTVAECFEPREGMGALLARPRTP